MVMPKLAVLGQTHEIVCRERVTMLKKVKFMIHYNLLGSKTMTTPYQRNTNA